jgi:hypothetical protein
MDFGIFSMGMTLDSNESHQSKKSSSAFLSFGSDLLVIIVSFFLDALRTDGFSMKWRSYRDAVKNSFLFHDYFYPAGSLVTEGAEGAGFILTFALREKQDGHAQETSCVTVAGRDRHAQESLESAMATWHRQIAAVALQRVAYQNFGF